jgi:proteasome beta subunit
VRAGSDPGSGSLPLVTLPLYPPHEDPGPDFAALARRAGLVPQLQGGALDGHPGIPHGTTCVALRYADGVVMAGDRRATSGNFISHRSIEKVFPADRHSGVAIAGAAGPAIEMVRLFQLQLEHYEKVEGAPLSLEGKANQLSQMVRNHLPAAMTGLAVVPLFAGFDRARSTGRLFQYDLTGGRYEEHDHAATGSGQMQATTVIKLGWRPGLPVDTAIDLTLRALLEAADEDSATGGPDMLRRIFPVVATISVDGFQRVPDEDLERRYQEMFDEIAVERGPSTSETPESLS